MSLFLRPLATQAPRFLQATKCHISSQMKNTAGISEKIAQRSLHSKGRPILPDLSSKGINVLLEMAEDNFYAKNYDGAIRVCDKILRTDSNHIEARSLLNISKKAKIEGSLPGF